MIKNLKTGKSVGKDGLSNEHLLYADFKLVVILTLLFNCMMIHGYIPSSLCDSLISPVVKDKSESITDKSNYRPIALSNCILKVIECLLLERMKPYLCANFNQFGFKAKHSTDMAIFVLKDLINFYVNHNSPMFICYLDASKAFDRINHNVLFAKLKNVPCYITRLLLCIYVNQNIYVKWNSLLSTPFCASNGIRQGSVLSPYLFSLYMDELSNLLNKSGVGCYFNDILLNHLMYADDIVLMCPSYKGLQYLIDKCGEYGRDHDILFNVNKTKCMCFKPKRYKQWDFPQFSMNNVNIDYVTFYKYLGHIISVDNDKKDIQRQIAQLYARGNTMINYFDKCSQDVKIILFRSYICNIYCSHLWTQYTQSSFADVTTAYNNIFRRFFHLPRFLDGVVYSATNMLSEKNLPTAREIIMTNVKSLYKRIVCSENVIFQHCSSAGLLRRSTIVQHWWSVGLV